MPAPIGPLVGFALGALLAWASGSDVSRDEDRGRAALLVALFAALVFAPVAGYFLTFAGDWAYAYLVDSRSIPSAADLVLALVDGGTVVLGFAVARERARARAFRAIVALFALPLAASALFVLLAYRRLRVDTTFRQFQGDFGAEPVAGGRLGYALLWMLGLLVAGFVITLKGVRGPPARPGSQAAGPDHDRPD